jgi:hemerythrin-like domain-containing protein
MSTIRAAVPRWLQDRATMTPSPRGRALPGFSSPAAGFDQPMAMLHACHDRVRRSLQLLQRLCERVADGRIDDAVRDAARDVLRYFDQAAPHHHEDEERHVFPRVLAAGPDPALRTAVLQLQQDHLQMAARWARLRGPLAALADGQTGPHGELLEAADHFRDIYEDHLRTEDTLVFPRAASLLDVHAEHTIGEEMAARRGVRRPDQLKGE